MNSKQEINIKDLTMKNTIIIICALSLSNLAYAKTTAKDGIDKIKSNLENSQANLADYKKNMSVVESNIAEVIKAKSQAEGQKKQISTQVGENKASLSKLEKNEKELNQLMLDEKNKSSSEEKKIKEFEEMIAKLKENQQKREKNIQDYTVQLGQIQEEKKLWQTRSESLKELDSQANTRVKTLAQQENEWKNKKRGYEGEVTRWNKETDKQKKLFEQYSSLAETKDN